MAINKLYKENILCASHTPHRSKTVLLYIFSKGDYLTPPINTNIYKFVTKNKVDDSLSFNERLLLLKAISSQVESALLSQKIIKTGNWFISLGDFEYFFVNLGPNRACSLSSKFLIKN